MRIAAGLKESEVNPPTPKKLSDAERIESELSEADRRALGVLPDAAGGREPFVDTSAHAGEREEAAQDKADRMAQWSGAKPPRSASRPTRSGTPNEPAGHPADSLPSMQVL